MGLGPAGMMLHPAGMMAMGPHMQPHMAPHPHLPPHMQMGMAHPAMGLIRAPHLPGMFFIHSSSLAIPSPHPVSFFFSFYGKAVLGYLILSVPILVFFFSIFPKL